MTTALIYPPSSYATTAELIEMAKVAGRYGGIYASHIRGEGRELVQSVEEAIEIGEKGGLPVEVFHLKAAFQPGWGKLMGEAGEKIDQARGRGVDVAADLYLYTAGGTGLEAVIPSWAFEGGDEKLLERLKDPTIRARLKNEIKTGSPGWWNIVEASGGWQNIVLVNASNKDNAKYEGKTIAAIAKELNKEPADVALRYRCCRQRQSARDLSHDERTGYRDRVAISVDEHRQRRRGRAQTGYGGRLRIGTSAKLRKFSAVNRALCSRKENTFARRSDPENDFLAGDANKARRQGRYQRRRDGRTSLSSTMTRSRTERRMNSRCLSPVGD
jgi:hypothetical protein